MADYNIYIHAIGTGASTQFQPTIPWSQREGGEGIMPTQSSTGANLAQGVVAFTSMAANPDGIVSSATSKFSHAIPIVAVAMAIVSLGNKIYETALDFETLKSGDYTRQIEYNNLRIALHTLLTPFSSTINILKLKEQNRIENAKRQMQRELLGDSVINAYTNRGI